MIIKWPDNRREHRGINLVCYGSSEPEGYTAMAQTVGFPCAIATRMVLDKEIQRKGMVLPFTKDIYKPMLDRSVTLILQYFEYTQFNIFKRYVSQ